VYCAICHFYFTATCQPEVDFNQIDASRQLIATEYSRQLAIIALGEIWEFTALVGTAI
jgi:hypothetical protein